MGAKNSKENFCLKKDVLDLVKQTKFNKEKVVEYFVWLFGKMSTKSWHIHSNLQYVYKWFVSFNICWRWRKCRRSLSVRAITLPMEWASEVTFEIKYIQNTFTLIYYDCFTSKHSKYIYICIMRLFYTQGKFCVQIHINFLPVQSHRPRPAVGSSGVFVHLSNISFQMASPSGCPLLSSISSNDQMFCRFSRLSTWIAMVFSASLNLYLASMSQPMAAGIFFYGWWWL